MKTWIGAIALALAVAAPSLTGTWTMNVQGGPHGDATMSLTLTQDGTSVSGTFVSGHGPDLAVKGTFEDGTLKLRTDSDEHAIVFEAKLKDDGSLAGFLSSPMGDMKWTARRADKAAQ